MEHTKGAFKEILEQRLRTISYKQREKAPFRIGGWLGLDAIIMVSYLVYAANEWQILSEIGALSATVITERKKRVARVG